jgi:acyl transferase domain-containing protein
LVAERGRLMQSMPEGDMLSVRLPEADIRPLVNGGLSVAVINSPEHCVVAGPHDEIAALQQTLEARGVACKPLHTSHAFHSAMMAPAVAPFRERVRQVQLKPARIPIISTQTGQWIQAADWAAPDYWARQLRMPVRFAEAAGTLLKAEGFILLEVGPGQTLTTLARQHPDSDREQLVLASLPPVDKTGELVSMRAALGRLWLAGVTVDWAASQAQPPRRRVALPTYPFERVRCWLEQPAKTSVVRGDVDSAPGATLTSTGSAEGTLANGNEPGRGRLTSDLAEELIRKQLQVMRQQLEALAKHGR